MTIVSAGPQGEVATLAEANEIRIVFSEPMVRLGQIPDPVRAPFFRITPAASGTFRWSGTTILIFTPDPVRRLPYATEFEVAIDTAATAVSGRQLAVPYRFTVMTPTARLLRATWMRRGGRYNGAFLAMLRFNQPLRPADVLAHLTARFQPHEWEDSWVSPIEASIRVRAPQSHQAFNTKVAAARAAAAAATPFRFAIATDWDKSAYPPSPDLVVLEAQTTVSPESWIRLQFDERLPSPAGPAIPAKPQDVRLDAEPAFFVTSFSCGAKCEPDSSNAVQMTRNVHVKDFSAAVIVADVSGGRRQSVQKSGKPRVANDFGEIEDWSSAFSIEDAGYDAQPPATTYEVRVESNLQARDGQTLGYTWVQTVDNRHRFAFTSFGDGHGVWEKGGGATLPFYSRNLLNVRQWAQPIQPSQLMPTILEQSPSFSDADGVNRRLNGTPDRIQSYGFDIAGALPPTGTGLLRAAIREGDVIPNASRSGTSDAARTRSSIVQVTNLGISVKDSPQNTLVFVTRLDTAVPVAGATISIIRLDNSVHWRGTTGADGVAIAPVTPLREDNNWWRLSFLVMAEKDGDVAYVGSDWNEGIQPWDFGASFTLNEAEPLLRGTVFTDRGVYRLGEEVHFKAVVRQNAPDGIHLLSQGSPILISIRDTQDRLIDERVASTHGAALNGR